MKKRIFSLLLALCMIISLLPVVALAEDTAQPAVSFNSGSTTVTLNAGDPAQVYGNNMTESDDSSWTIKFEYPLGDVPTVTLRNATIKNGTNPLHFAKSFGSSTVNSDSPVKVVLEGTNTIEGTATGISPLHFYTTGDVTFTGSGKLDVISVRDAISAGVIHGLGDVIFDNTNVKITISDNSSSAGHAIASRGGDIIVKGGKLTVVGCSVSQGAAIYAAFYATKDTDGTGGNLTIQDGANVKVVGNPGNSGSIASLVEIEGTFTIKESDVEFGIVGTTNYKVFDARPTTNLVFANGCTVTATSNKFNGAAKPTFVTAENGEITITAPAVTETYNSIDAIPESTDTNKNHIVRLWYLKVAHNCVEDEQPVYEGFDCSTNKYAVYHCSICGKEMRRESTTVDPTEAHTPGEWTVKAITNATKTTSGTYKLEQACTVCGEITDTKEESFEAGIFWWSNGDAVGSQGSNSKPSGVIELNPALNPDEAVKYYTTTASNSTNYPDRVNIVAGDKDNWCIKLEYPVQGNPIMTLKDATLVHSTGIYYGVGAYAAKAPLNIVVESDSTIEVSNRTNQHYSYHGGLSFVTDKDVTIAGPGKLTIMSDANTGSTGSAGAIDSNGNIILDHVNIDLTLMTAGTGSAMGISTTGGDITIKGSTVNIIGWSDPTATANYAAMKSAFYVADGDLTIQDGSNVLVFGDPANSSLGNSLIYIGGKLTVKESTLEAALAGKNCYQPIFNNNKVPTIDPIFANGYVVTTGTTASSYTPTTDGSLGTLVRPTVTNDPVENAIPETLTGLKYFKITEKAAEESWTVESFNIDSGEASLSLESEVFVNLKLQLNGVEGIDPAELIEHMGLAVFYTKTASSADSTVDNANVLMTDVSYDAESYYYIFRSNGIAAKNMGDSRWYKAYVTLPDGTVIYSPRLEYSPKQYALNKVADANENEGLKALCVAMMNYGAKAQAFFAADGSYTYDEPMNADFEEYQSLVRAYDSSMITERVLNTKELSFDYNNSDFSGNPDVSLSLEGAIDMNFTFTAANEGTITSAGIMIWDAEKYSQIESFTLENASAVIEASEIVGSTFKSSYIGTAAKEMGDTVYAVAFYEIDGTTYYSGVITRSAEIYASSKINEAGAAAELVDTLQAMVVYGDHAKSFFA